MKNLTPLRWAKNIVVTACIAALIATTLAGCFGGEPARPNYSDLDFEVRLHHGRDAAWYVVQLTEQEMHNILREQFAAAGLYFADAPLDYTVETDALFETGWDLASVGLDWFDADRNAAVSFITWQDDNPQVQPGDFADRATKHFAQLTDTPVGVFYNPSVNLSRVTNWRDGWQSISPEDEDVVLQLPLLVARLRAQVNAFLYSLGEQPELIDLQVDVMHNRVRFTQEQALSIIRAELEAAGLNFVRNAPNISIHYMTACIPYETSPTFTSRLLLFDQRANVGVALTNNWDGQFFIEHEFAQVSDMSMGVFRLAEGGFGREAPSQTQALIAAQVMRTELVMAAQTFITHLQSQGIL